jgi:hypothetical protein
MGGFANPVVAGGVLRVPEIQSVNFEQDVQGWAILRNGLAYFTGLVISGAIIAGGSITLTNPADGILCYNGTPAPGNLLISISPSGGTDDFGNTYPPGIFVASGAGLINGNVLTAGSVTGNALAAATILAGNLAAGSVTAAAIAAAAVGASQLAAGAVYPGAIQTGAVTSNSLAAGAVVAGTIAAGALNAINITTGILTVQGSQGAILVYNGTAGAGTLFVSIAPQGGIDQFGNAYPKGIAVTNNGTISGADLIIKPSQGALLGYSQ